MHGGAHACMHEREGLGTNQISHHHMQKKKKEARFGSMQTFLAFPWLFFFLLLFVYVWGERWPSHWEMRARNTRTLRETRQGASGMVGACQLVEAIVFFLSRISI